MKRTVIYVESRTSGFSLIELLIGLGIFALLIVLAIPAYRSWLVTSQIRNAASAFTNGMQTARAEAIRRNVLIQLVVGADATGKPTWTITESQSGALVQQWSAKEGATQTKVDMRPAIATTVTFNGLGRVVTNADNSSSIRWISVSALTDTSPEIRPMRVIVGTGGSVRMCDPQVAAGDPRACS